MSHTPPVDSKGAAIEELKQILKHYYLYMKNCEIAGDSKISHTAVKGAINAANEFNEETVEAILAILAQEYRRGYNDNARDCNCDKFSVTPHKHLMDDGESHNIRPDIERLG